jgi:hypothetical protein
MGTFALGTGIYIAFYINMLSRPHAIISFMVIVGCILQPVTGLWHRYLYKRSGNGSENGKEVGCMKLGYKLTHMHVWWGRILIMLGIINGGLGLQLSRQLHAIDTPIEAEVGYGVGAGVFWVVWMGVSVVGYLRNKHKNETGKGEKVLGMQTRSGEETPVVALETPQSKEEKDMPISFVF